MKVERLLDIFMYEYQVLKKLLLKNVSAFLVNYGFEKKIYDQSFLKPIDKGKGMIHLSFIPHVGNFDVTVSVSVRFNEVEDMINDFMETNPSTSKIPSVKKLLSKTSTLGCELGNLTEGAQKRWRIADESDIDSVTKSICEIILNVAFPYIEKHKDMEYAFGIMCRDDSEAILQRAFHDRRAMSAVALALVLQKNDMVEEIITAKTKFLQERNDPCLDWFLQFVDVVVRDRKA